MELEFIDVEVAVSGQLLVGGAEPTEPSRLRIES